jgi:hypothetical protein
MQPESPDSSATPPKWWAPPCFFLGLALVLSGLYLLGRPNYVEKAVREDRQKLRKLDEARFVVVGASHGEGVDLERVGVEGQNFSHGGQDLFEMVYIARSVVQQAPALETVIIVLSYFTFALDNAAYERRGVTDRIGRRIEMYSAFPRLAFIPGDHAEYAKGLLYPIVTRDHFQLGFERTGRRLLRLFSEEEHPPRGGKHPHARSTDAAGAPMPRGGLDASAESSRAPAPDDDEGEGEDEGEGDPQPGDDGAAAPEPSSASEPGDLEPGAAHAAEATRARRPSTKSHGVKDEAWYARHAVGRCRYYSGLMDNMRAHHPNLERDTFRTLQELVRDLAAKHLSVVLLTPPYLPAYSNCFDARMQRITRANATRLAQTTGVRYFDLTKDPAFTTKLGLFVDSDHLRPHGKELLARKLAALLHLPEP